METGNGSPSSKTSSARIRVLLLEDNPIDARFLSVDFERHGQDEFSLKTSGRLTEALEVLRNEKVDVILLDLFLQETQGLDTLEAVREKAPDVPVVVLTSLNDEALALQALKHGAQDYLIKGSTDSRWLFRAIRYAVERMQVEADRRSLEERSLQMKRLEALGTLAGGVAHNFNNMLMAIKGHTHLLRQSDSDDARNRHLEAIDRAAVRASALTRQLLLFGRKGTVERKPIDLNDILRDMQELIRSVVGDDIALTMDLVLDPIRISADHAQIQHMIMSLILNARGAIASRGVINIRTEWNKNGAGGYARLTVMDDGCGMSEETVAHIFEPFFTTKGLAVAAGLGLSNVYGIVERHEGSIQVSSELGRGSRFEITFPGLPTVTGL